MHGQLEVLVSRYVKDQDMQMDLLQDIFIKIQANIDRLQSTKKLIPWVHTVARNTIMDHFRKEKKEATLKQLLKLEFEDDSNFKNDISICLTPMIDQLDDKYKQALILSELKNLKQQEIADQLGISLSGAKSRVQRGKKKLKEVLLQCCEIEADHYGNIMEVRKRNCDCQ